MAHEQEENFLKANVFQKIAAALIVAVAADELIKIYNLQITQK